MSATQEQRAESVDRAVNGQSVRNYEAIIAGFAERGIAATPREDVFTYNAWRGLGRQVRKGEHGIKIETWIPCKSKADENGERESYKRRKVTAVFHVSQTDATEEG
jgi:antirestriction protein ArdC